MAVPQFAFIKHPQFTGTALIQGTDFPFPVFRVYAFEQERHMHHFIHKHKLENACAIPDEYNIAVCYIGNINQLEAIPLPAEVTEEGVLNQFSAVKNFYQQNRIKGNESRMKKFKKVQ